MFDAEGLVFRYPGGSRAALDSVDISIPRGTLYCIIGPNGSGKSTLLRVLLGLLRPDRGIARFDGRPLADWSRAELARRVGVVSQVEEIVFPIRVHEMVFMGRYAHLGAWRRPGVEDHAAVESAMTRCGVTRFAGRAVTALSGGERQRVRLARALAQSPDTFALDEPTASLDVAHEMTIFEMLARLGREDGATVVVVTHNLNLAARYADRLLLLERGRVVAEGPPHTVFERATLERVYGWPLRIVSHPGPGPDTGAPQVVPLVPDAAHEKSPPPGLSEDR